MNVCVLAVLHESDDKRVYHKVIRSLAAAGYTVTYICPRAPVHRNQPVTWTDPEGIRFIHTPPASGLFSRLLATFRLIRVARKVPSDVLVAPEPESWMSALLLKMLCFGRTRVVFDMHEYVAGQFAHYFPPFLRPLVERLTRRVMRAMARFTRLIILTRESFDSEWAGLSVPRITVINTNHPQPPCAERAPELTALGPDAEIILHQGVFSAKRGAYQLLDAVALLAPHHPALRCVILGRYVSDDEPRFRDAIHEKGLKDHVVLIPEVPFSKVPSFIAGARVGLILFQPGIRNHVLAMPHKLFDYMREGCPVIAPDFAVEVARIVRDTRCGLLVDVTRPEAIAEAIDRLLRDHELARTLGMNGRKAVEERYNWAYDEQVLLEGFARHVGSPDKPGRC